MTFHKKPNIMVNIKLNIKQNTKKNTSRNMISETGLSRNKFSLKPNHPNKKKRFKISKLHHIKPQKLALVNKNLQLRNQRSRNIKPK